MTQAEFHDLQQLGGKIKEYCRTMENLRAIKEGRMNLAKGLRAKYPNMKIEVVRDRIWAQEDEFANIAQLAFDGMRGYANSLGWNLEHKDVRNELTGILRTTYPNLIDINV